jgi:biotin transport system substrate-specific component
MNAHTVRPTLAEAIWNSDLPVLRNVVLAVAATIALWISAKIQVPLYPVPITMQTFVVLAVGMAFGWRLGAATMLLYLAEGAIGMPVFAGTPERGIGLAYMMGPTGGFLVSYVFAAALVGWLASKGWDRNPLSTLAAMFLGSVVIYAIGLAWLAQMTGWSYSVIEKGALPFLYGDAVKMLLAAAILPVAWKLVGRRQQLVP